MSESPRDAPARGRGEHRPRALIVLAAVIALEAAALVALTVFLLFELLTVVPDSYPSAIGLTLVTAIAATGMVMLTIHTARGSAWVRGAIVTVQVLALAVAVGSFQGLFARPDIGWIILVPAIIALALLFTRSVVAATARRE